MPQPTQAALRERARLLLVGMTERSRWIYALPRKDDTWATVRGIFDAEALPEVASEADGKVRKYVQERPEVRFVVFDNEALDVVLLEGEGQAGIPILQRILTATDFVPQSHLWGGALAIGDPGATRALTILAHMAVCWDEDWTDLFLLHLASPDAVVRHDATNALTVAAMVAREVGPALQLLAEAQRRETYPKLSETIADAIRVLEAFAGKPVDVAELS